MPLIERIILRSVLMPSGCWIWMGATVVNINGTRYGCIKVKGKTMLAHRAAWEAVHGVRMSKRKHGAHACDTPLCVNPDHIRGATPSSNQKEAYAKGRKVAPETLKRMKILDARTLVPA